MAVIGLILSAIMIQRHSVNGQNCYIDNFNNSNEYLNNCDSPANVKTLVLNVTNLKNIPHDVIDRVQSVESIDVSNTSLQEINQGLGLCQWNNLKCINADDNNITTLHADILDDCHQLNALSLARNKIRQIYEQAFMGLSSLTELDLSSNQLTSLSAGTFETLINLRTLRLNNNMIRSINLDHFAKTAKLQVLDLSFNAIEEIEPHAFEQLKELTTLSIQCNPSLKSLDLNGMDKLYTLDAYNASLSHLNIPMNVKAVNADNNKITYVTIEPNSRLQDLSLKNNSFQNLNNLTSALQLKELDISSNNITDIDFAVLMKTNLEQITALENPIHSLNVTSLITLPKLKVIEISTSRLDNNTLIDLMVQTKSKGIWLVDPSRASETLQVVTLPPVTPVAANSIAGDSTTTASSSTTTTPPPPFKPSSNSTDQQLQDLMNRIRNLESTLANQRKNVSTNGNADIKQSLSNLRFLVNCMVFVVLAFVTFKVVIFLRTNHWSISHIFSRTLNVPVNGGRTLFNDTVDERL